jgi:hypothetical protein
MFAPVSCAQICSKRTDIDSQNVPYYNLKKITILFVNIYTIHEKGGVPPISGDEHSVKY